MVIFPRGYDLDVHRPVCFAAGVVTIAVLRARTGCSLAISATVDGGW